AVMGRESSIQRARTAAALQGSRSAAAAATPGPGPRDRSRPAPLSFSQLRLWLLQQWEPAAPTFNAARAFRLRGELDLDALPRPWTARPPAPVRGLRRLATRAAPGADARRPDAVLGRAARRRSGAAGPADRPTAPRDPASRGGTPVLRAAAGRLRGHRRAGAR